MPDQLSLAITPPTAEKSPFLAACRVCNHVWPIVWTPCLVRVLTGSRNPRCPCCGTAGKKVVIASKASGDLGRYVRFLEVELERARKEAA